MDLNLPTRENQDRIVTALETIALGQSPLTEITHGALVELRDNEKLNAGSWYRITDYITTTIQEETQSAGHAFDVIVLALDEKTLSEEARAIKREGDSYFNRNMIYVSAIGAEPFVYTPDANELQGSDYFYAWYDSTQDLYLYTLVEHPVPGVDLEYGKEEGIIEVWGDGITSVSHITTKLEAWKIWYCLDNDTHRFAWADEENGKGVIYRMIDEFNNDCPYDFKNIQFIRKITDGEYDPDGDDRWVYTFTWVNEDDEIEDLSLIGNSLLDDEGSIVGMFGNEMGEASAYYVGIGEGNNVFALGDNTFIDSYANDSGFFYGCYNNKFGGNCFGNTFGSDVSSNSFGSDVYNNTFGSDVYNNTFGSDVSSNSFGNSVYNNSFGNSVYNNTFGSDVYNNTFGNSVYNNTFGSDVSSNSFGNSVYNNTFGNYFAYNTVKTRVQYVRTPDAVYPNAFQYATLENGLVGASAANRLNLEGIQAVVGYSTPIKVTRGTGTEIVAVWQNGIALAGLRKATPTTADWTDIPNIIGGGE